MRRDFGAGWALLLGAVVAHPAAAQRSTDVLPLALLAPRPDPVLPAALVPFAVSPDLCRHGHTPRVTLRVYNVFAEPVATLAVRGRRAEVLDSVSLRCGTYVAFWDGTVDHGKRVASPGIYWLRLIADDRSTAERIIIAQP